MNKVYFSKNKSKIVFSIKVENSVKNISFSNFGGSYSTSNKEEQEAIEKSYYYKTGLIYLSGDFKSEKIPDIKKSDIEPVEYPEVSDLNDAVSILRAKPYNVHHTKLKNREAILSVAKDIGVSFPNLKVE